MLTQKMSKESSMLVAGANVKEVLIKTVKLFDTTLTGLINGSKELGLPRCDDKAVAAQLKYIDSLWKPFRLNIETVIKSDGKTMGAVAYIQANNVTLLKEMNKAVKLMEKKATASSVQLLYVQGGAVTLIVLLLSFTWFKVISPLITKLSNIADSAQCSSNRVADYSLDISSAGTTLAEGATEQAASLEETAATLEEIGSQAKANADNSNKANSNMAESKCQVGSGAEAVRNMTRAMEEINDSSSEISKIIKTIEEIAFQTNLLALNAAVEAARAGEAGKGFAVVAEEVRNLSQRASEAAKDTTTLIEGTVVRVENGSEIVDVLSRQFEVIEDGVQKVNCIVEEIARASREQAHGVEQVNSAVEQLDIVTQRNAASAEESASASNELSNQANNLQLLVRELTGIIHGK